MVVKGRWLAAHMTSGPAPQLGKSNFSRLKLFLSPNSPSNVRVYTTCTCWRCLIRRESVKEVDIRSSTWCIHRVGCDSVLQTYIYYAGEDARVASHALWHCVEMVLAPVHKKRRYSSLFNGPESPVFHLYMLRRALLWPLGVRRAHWPRIYSLYFVLTSLSQHQLLKVTDSKFVIFLNMRFVDMKYSKRKLWDIKKTCSVAWKKKSKPKQNIYKRLCFAFLESFIFTLLGAFLFSSL
jgi:hypothetical protein